PTSDALLLVAALLPLTAAISALGAILNGLRRVPESLVPAQIVLPGLVCSGAAFGLLVWGKSAGSAIDGLLLQLTGSLAAFGAAVYLLGRHLSWRAIARAQARTLPRPPRDLLRS